MNVATVKTEKPVKVPNYTAEQTAKAVADYQAGVDIVDIARALGKTVKSVRAKLVREEVYKAVEKPTKSPKAEGPTKKEMLISLSKVAPFAVDGFEACTKGAIEALLRHFEANPDPVSMDTEVVTDEIAEAA